MPVGGGHDNDGTGQPLLAEIFLDELPDLPSPFPDEGDDVGPRVPRDHAEQDALPDAGAGKNTHLLPLAAGKNGIDGSNAEIHDLRYPSPLEGVDRLRVQGVLVLPLEGSRVVDGVADAVQDTTEEIPADPDDGPFAERNDPAPRADPLHVVEGHEQHVTLPETHHLGPQGLAIPPAGVDMTHLSHERGRPAAFHHQPDDLGHFSVHPDRVDATQAPVVTREVEFTRVCFRNTMMVSHGRFTFLRLQRGCPAQRPCRSRPIALRASRPPRRRRSQ